MSDKLDALQFDNIISTTSYYGVVWKGLHKNRPCAVKMVILTSGLHYDYGKGKYRGDDRKHADKYFSRDEQAPFLHSHYRQRRAMTPEDFEYESEMIQKISRLDLAPQLFDVWIDRTRPMHYGFIVMELIPETIKGILLKRDLTRDELKRTHDIISSLHSKGFCHGDLKPSNMGCHLNDKGEIDRIRFLDLMKCRRIKHRDEIKRDVDTFKRHAKDNADLRSKHK